MSVSQTGGDTETARGLSMCLCNMSVCVYAICLCRGAIAAASVCTEQESARESERERESKSERKKERCASAPPHTATSRLHNQITHTSRSGRSGFSITSVRDCTQKSTPCVHGIDVNNFYAHTVVCARERSRVRAHKRSIGHTVGEMYNMRRTV
jgi:hypothetical protein